MRRRRLLAKFNLDLDLYRPLIKLHLPRVEMTHGCRLELVSKATDKHHCRCWRRGCRVVCVLQNHRGFCRAHRRCASIPTELHWWHSLVAMGDHVTMVPMTPVSSYMHCEQRQRSVHVQSKKKKAKRNGFDLSGCLYCEIPSTSLVFSWKTMSTLQPT